MTSPLEQVCYVGDEKYNIPKFGISGLAVCSVDAIGEARAVVDVVLVRGSEEECLSEIFT